MKLIYTRPDGGVSIVCAVAKPVLEKALGPLTDEAYRAHVLERSLPKDASAAQIMPDGWEPPADRSFRDAWGASGKTIAVDMTKARDIQRGRLRAERAPILASLDVEALRAFEARDDAKADIVKIRKQKLRDLPAHPAIDAAATPEELKALTLAALIDG